MKQIKIVNTLLLSLLICSGGQVIGEPDLFNREPDVFNDNLKSKVDSPDKRSLYQRFQESELATKAKNLLMRKVENENMVERKRINSTGREDDLTALHIASREGNLKEAKRFLDSGANVYAKDALGKTALHYAAQNGHSEIVNELLKKGAAVNAKDNDENTPLHLAYYAKQNSDYDKSLIRQVKVPYEKYYKLRTDDQKKGQKYDYGIIENLINSGADENIRNNMHEVPGYDYYDPVVDPSMPIRVHINPEHRRDITRKEMSLDRSNIGIDKNGKTPQISHNPIEKESPTPVTRQSFIDNILND